MPSTDFTGLVCSRLLIKTTTLKTLQLLINHFLKTKKKMVAKDVITALHYLSKYSCPFPSR